MQRSSLLRPPTWPTAAGALWLAAVACLALFPAPVTDPRPDTLGRLCLICGDRGTSDAILNIWFFVPLGLVMAARGKGWRYSWVIGTLLSTGIETAQLVLPGRYPTLGDVVWNGLGAALGAALFRGVAAHRRRGPAASPRSGRAAAVGVGLSLALAGWLLGPSPTHRAYWGQWTPDLGFMPRYEGRLLEATFGGTPFPRGRFPPHTDGAATLRGPWVLRTVLVKGPPPPSVSPVASIYDADQDEILVLGVDGDDIVLRERTRAKAFRMDHPDLRTPGGLASIPVGDPVTLGVRRDGDDRCISVDEQESCGKGFTPGRTWGLLLYVESLPEWARRVVDAGWLLMLFAPLGLLAPLPRHVLGNAGIAVVTAMSGVMATRMTAPTMVEIGGSLAGLAVGWWARSLFRTNA
ncbi:MAG: VanZ family protein [Gemmatimonadota bacterium]|nr:VanZ family protein [Gemmatimonadota bacterium]